MKVTTELLDCWDEPTIEAMLRTEKTMTRLEFERLTKRYNSLHRIAQQKAEKNRNGYGY